MGKSTIIKIVSSCAQYTRQFFINAYTLPLYISNHPHGVRCSRELVSSFIYGCTTDVLSCRAS